jgi:hypothetical protein
MTDGEFYSTSSSSFGPSVPSTSSESNSPTSTLHPDSSTCLKDGTSRNPSSSDILCSFKKNIKKAVINDKPHQSRRLLDNMDINSEDFAKRNAKKLYYCLAYPYGFAPLVNEAHRCLVVADFEPYFHSADEAKRAFDTFDRDSNGDITRREFRDTVLQMYRERKDISISIRDTSQALGKVDLMLLVVTLIAILLTSFAIFNVEVLHSLLPLGSILLAMTFIFGNTAKNTFESMMFLFITHPYDAGDFILIDGNMLLVHNMGIMGTVFISGDGQTIYAPTTVLMTKLITNVRRSGSMGETIKVNIDFNTTTDQYWELHDRLSAWLSGNTRDFGPGFDLRLVDIVDVNQLILNVWLPHKGNWQEIGPRFRRKTRFLLALKDILQELHIQYHLPTQTYTKAPSSSVENTDHQSFHTNQDTTSMDPERARAIENARRERLRRDRNDYSQTGSTTAGGDGGW